MNIIRMTGGLGNQMFQYALYLKLLSMGREVKLDDISEYETEDARPLMLWAFGLQYEKASKEEINQLTDGCMDPLHRAKRMLFGRKSLQYHEKGCNFDEEILNRDPAYLTGYFQSEKYFAGVEEQVRSAFTFSDQIWSKLEPEQAGKIKEWKKQIDEKVSVSIHIRRGDYLDSSAIYGNICTDAYYKKAISLIKEKFPGASFFVFSNEPAWALEWVKTLADGENDFTVIEGTTEETGYVDMLLMSSCHHHIIANSSFSWWGAWLGKSKDKCVIAPSKWLNNQENHDIYTNQMIKISPKGEVTA